MKSILGSTLESIVRILPLKRSSILSVAILALLIIFNFYGIYTNKFYFFKPDNYIFLLLSTVHFTFLYVLWFKVKEDELTDPKMRNIEYILYGVLLIYIYKVFESIYVLTTYYDYENFVMPSTFLPMGILILALYIMLTGLTLLTFKYRKEHVGKYKFDDINHIDSWE